MKTELTIDTTARRVLMAAYLYYRHDTSIMSDGEFDEMCLRLARRWFVLDPFLKWQLGSAHDLGSGGAHLKITQACEGGALSWARRRLLTSLPPHGGEWNWDDARAVHWITAS